MPVDNEHGKHLNRQAHGLIDDRLFEVDCWGLNPGAARTMAAAITVIIAAPTDSRMMSLHMEYLPFWRRIVSAFDVFDFV